MSDIATVAEPISRSRSPVGLDRSWGEIEREFGTELPDDYKGFIDLYGTGVLCDITSIWNFRDDVLFSGQPLALLQRGGGTLALYREIGTWGYEWPFPLFPAAVGDGRPC